MNDQSLWWASVTGKCDGAARARQADQISDGTYDRDSQLLYLLTHGINLRCKQGTVSLQQCCGALGCAVGSPQSPFLR